MKDEAKRRYVIRSQVADTVTRFFPADLLAYIAWSAFSSTVSKSTP
jgi:hypothetical protein